MTTRAPKVDPVAAFAAAMRAAGIEPPAELVADGKVHRFRIEGDKRGSQNGWFVLHLDGIPAGAFGSWRLGISESWASKTEARMSAQERDAHRARIAAADAARAGEEARRHKAAARIAAQVWGRATSAEAHAYTTRKGVKLYGLRVGAFPKWDRDASGAWVETTLPDALLVPMCDAAGALCSLQAILADGRKLFLPNGRKRGCFHLVGELREHADALLVAEGYATAATLHEATGYPVAVSFDAGNLDAVARALREKHPAVRLVLCADDDHKTDGNPGIAKARAAANVVAGLLCAPTFAKRSDGATDFNDLAAAEGLDAVKRFVESTLSDPRAVETIARKAKATASEPPAAPFARFSARPEGIYWQKDAATSARWLCEPLEVLAHTRDPNGRGWGLLVRFRDPDGDEHRIVIAAELFAGDGIEAVRLLLSEGLEVAPNLRRELVEFLQSSKTDTRARVTPRLGWHGDLTRPVFVTPAGCIGGNDGEPWIFSGESPSTTAFKSRGTLDEWREGVAALAVGNSRVTFALSAGFASALLFATGAESGGFHWVGPSSVGKTTLLKVSASMSGGQDSVQRWRSTDNALEGVALAFCDAPLCLDELAQVAPRIAGEVAYMLANGSGKSRATRTGAARERAAWRVLFASTGEIGLSDHVAEVGGKIRAGQEVRLVEIPADARQGFGVFESLHGFADGASLSRELDKRTRRTYGTAWPAFIEKLAPRLEELPEDYRGVTKRFEHAFVPDRAGGQAHRVAGRFALVALAGELVAQFGIAPWPAGAAFEAAGTCFRAWLERRGTVGDGEELAMLRQVRGFLELHGEGRFSDWSRPLTEDTHAPRTLVRAGVRKVEPEGGIEFYVFPEVFRSDMCKGHDPHAVARLLAARGYLRTEEAGRLTCKPRLPGDGARRCYVVKGDILEGGDDA